MNRRTFLSALATTSLTPLVPPQIFASGGIVSPDHCGFIAEAASAIWHGNTILTTRTWTRILTADKTRLAAGIDPISIFAIAMYGDGKPWRGGIITT
jgi:hypothetical protein